MPDLETSLHALAADLRVADPGDGLVTAVMDRVATEPVPVRPPLARRLLTWLGDRWRRIVAAVGVVVVVGALAPPVRAQVAELFGFSGVIVSRSPGAGPSTAPPPPQAGPLTFDQARRLIRFAPRLPSELGPPSGAEVSVDDQLLSLSWTGRGTGVIRLDEFDGGLQPYFWKSVYQEAERVSVGNRDALWFPGAHEVAVLGHDGRGHTLPPRVAGPTLVFELGGITVRLEGARDITEALSIAGTIR